MRLSLLMTALLLGGAAVAAQAAPIYKWVDASGVTHFSSQPPSPDVQQVRNAPAVKPPAPKPADPGAAAEAATQKDIDERVRQEVAKTEKERADWCVQTRTSLTQLRNNPRIEVEVEGGQRRRLGEDERQAKIAEAEKGIAETCK